MPEENELRVGDSVKVIEDITDISSGVSIKKDSIGIISRKIRAGSEEISVLFSDYDLTNPEPVKSSYGNNPEITIKVPVDKIEKV